MPQSGRITPVTFVPATFEEIGQRDHALTNYYVIFGGPGTAKTTHVSRQVGRAYNKFGRRILVTSFSRTATRELIDRLAREPISDRMRCDLDLMRSQVRTLHSHCYHSLAGLRKKSPDDPHEKEPLLRIAEARVSLWNQLYPQWSIVRERAKSDRHAAGRVEAGLHLNPEDASDEDIHDLSEQEDEFQYARDANSGRNGDNLLKKLNRLR